MFYIWLRFLLFLRIFYDDPVLPDNGYEGRNWLDDFQLTLHKQDEVRVTRPTGNIFLTNIHRVYSGDDIPPSPDDENTMDYFLGKRPTGATTLLRQSSTSRFTQNPSPRILTKRNWKTNPNASRFHFLHGPMFH